MPPFIHTQVAEMWIAADGPDAKARCPMCLQYFRVAGGAGPSLICPACGHCVDDGALQYIMRVVKDRVKARPAPAPELVEAVPSAAPPGLDDVIGNASAVAQIRTALEAHRARVAAGSKAAFPHILLVGVGGLGKTLLAQIIAREIKRPFREQMGQTMNNPARVGDVLRSLKAGDVLFIDEIHGLKPACQEALYLAMESGVYVPMAKAGQAVGAPIRLPPFTLIGATTNEEGLKGSFLQRFKYQIELERMTAVELAAAVAGVAARKQWAVTPGAAATIAALAHGTPRLALRILDQAMDMALAGQSNVIDEMVVAATCRQQNIDSLGLGRRDRRYLAVLDAAGGAAVRLNVLASQLDVMSRRGVEITMEPTLLWMGLVEKTPAGRILTARGREHIRKGKA